MKKIIMATLLMGLVSVASAQVTINGKVSAFVDNSKVGNGSTSTQLVTEPTSNFALSVKEKMGRDLFARATVETSLRGNTFGGDDTRVGDRQTTVGLANKFGSVDLGRNVHSHFLAITKNDVFGTLYGSIAGDVHNLRGLRLNDAVYATVSPVKGTTVAYERSLNSPVADAEVFAGSTKFAKVHVDVARFQQGAEKSTVLAAQTKLMGMTVAYVHSDNEGLVKSKGQTLGVARDMGHITAKASYGRTNTDTTAYNVGADYNLSKRTALHVVYRNVDRSAVSCLAIGCPAANGTSGFGVGVTHKF